MNAADAAQGVSGEVCTTAHNKDLNRESLVQGKCKSFAPQSKAPALPPEVEKLAGVWPTLPAHVRLAIMALAGVKA